MEDLLPHMVDEAAAASYSETTAGLFLHVADQLEPAVGIEPDNFLLTKKV
jgi:hypothetical protein